jgi:hypothetical protein
MDSRSILWLKQAQGEHKWAKDTLPGGVPCEMFVRSQAEEALRLAELFLLRPRAELGDV